MAVPPSSWLGEAAGFGGVSGPSPFLAVSPSLVIPRHSWLGHVAGSYEVCGPCGSSVLPFLAVAC